MSERAVDSAVARSGVAVVTGDFQLGSGRGFNSVTKEATDDR